VIYNVPILKLKLQTFYTHTHTQKKSSTIPDSKAATLVSTGREREKKITRRSFPACLDSTEGSLST